jgi:Concanavalin A-like lectin/glucanases superfamily
VVLGLAIAAGQAGCGGGASTGNAGAAGGHENTTAGSGGAGIPGAAGGAGGAANPGGGATGTAGSSTDAGGGASGAGAGGGSGAVAGASGADAGGAGSGAGASGADAGPLDTGPVVMNPPDSVVWHIDNLLTIGGKPISKTVGKPMVIDTPAGKAVQFNATATGTSGDALFVDVNPVAGYAKWTAEVIFRPDAGGAQAQRWFHMSEGLAGGVGNRVLFELRVDGNNWFLVSFVQGGEIGRLYAVAFPHPLGAWYHVAIVIDGATMKHYVNGVYENAGPCPKTEGCTPADVQMLPAPFPLKYAPIGAGGTSLACRYTQEAFLKGAIRLARFTPRALTPAEFLPPP